MKLKFFIALAIAVCAGAAAYQVTVSAKQPQQAPPISPELPKSENRITTQRQKIENDLLELRIRRAKNELKIREQDRRSPSPRIVPPNDETKDLSDIELQAFISDLEREHQSRSQDSN